MIQSDRLIYKFSDLSDLENIQTCLNTPDMARQISFIWHPYTIEDASNWIARGERGMCENKEWFHSAYTKSGIYVGNVNLYREENGLAEIGYWVHPDYRRQGYATEMVLGALDQAFGHLGFTKVYATAGLDNISSQRVAEKAGFTRIAQIDVSTKRGLRPSWRFEHSRI